MRVLRSRKRWVVSAVALVVIAGGGATAWALTRPSSASASPTTTTVTVASSDLSRTVAATGTVEPKRQQTLTFPVSGTVTSVPVVVGQAVAQGAVLATVDTTSLLSAVDTATAAVTAAQAQVTAAAGSSATQVASASAQLAQAQSQLAGARKNLAAATLTAPFSGVVASVGYAVGDAVGSSGSSGSSGSGTSGGSGGSGGAQGGTAATTSATAAGTSSGVTLISTDAWVVTASVGSADLAQLKKGLQAQITPTGTRTTVFGTVSSIGIVATATSGGTATFPVVIDVTGNPAGLFAGASATVSVIVQKLTGVLTVATAAVSTQDGRTVVHKVVAGRQVVTPVSVGTVYGPLTEVRSGLQVGDLVAVTTPVGFGTGARARGTGAGGAGGVPGAGFPGAGGGAARGGNG